MQEQEQISPKHKTFPGISMEVPLLDLQVQEVEKQTGDFAIISAVVLPFPPLHCRLMNARSE